MKSCLTWWLGVLVTLCLPSMGFGSPAPQAGERHPPAGTVAVTAIKGQLLSIEIFSMYCPPCQREAPAVNRLYQAIEASPKLRGQVKMIGIGVGNCPFEIGHFRTYSQIQFPLFSDAEFRIPKKLGDVRTPFLIIVGLAPENRGNVLWTGAGKMGSQEAFIARLQKLLEQR